MSGHTVVMVSADEVAAWAGRWPASGLRGKGAVAFTFESDGGLVDIEPYGWDDGADEAAVAALTQDARQGIVGTVVSGAHGTPLLGTPHVRGNPRGVPLTKMFPVGTRVVTSELAGVDRNKRGVIVSPRLNNHGVPITTHGGDYNQYNARRERVVQFDDGGTATVNMASLRLESARNAGDVHIDIDAHNARGAGAKAMANPVAAVPVEIRGDGSDWIRLLSFFQRYRRGSVAKFAHGTVLRTKSTGVAGSDDVEVVLHETPIVTFHADGTMTLNSGGYRTATTKARLNAMLPPSVHLVQPGGKWLLRSGGDSFPFFDGMRFGVATFPHGHRSPG